MVLADQSLNGGANGNHIRTAFQRHDILLGTNALLAPSMALAGTAPKGATLAAATRRDLVRRLGGGRGARLTTTAANVFGTRMVQAMHTREIPLGDMDSRLRGVVAMAHEPVMVGASGRRASVVGTMPHGADSEAEVRSFVQSLLEHGRIELGQPKGKAKKRLVASVQGGPDSRRTRSGPWAGRRSCDGCGSAAGAAHSPRPGRTGKAAAPGPATWR
jgi:hypothetical protein